MRYLNRLCSVLMVSACIVSGAVAEEAKDDWGQVTDSAIQHYLDGDTEGAIELSIKGAAIAEQQQGPDHPDVATSLNNLGRLYQHAGRFEEALPPLQRALTIREKHDGPDALSVASTLTNLGGVFDSQGDAASAEPYFTRALKIYQTHPEAAPHSLVNALHNMESVYRDQEKHAQAIPLLDRLVASYQAKGEEHRGGLVDTLEKLLDSLEKADEPERAKTVRVQLESLREEA